MADEEHLRIVQVFLAIGVLCVWYVVMYKRTRADRLREDLFTIRDELFDYMWQHGLSYDLPAYQQMRDLLNGGIRFSEQLNLIPVLLVAYLVHRVRPHKEFSLPKAIKEIDDPETRGYFEEVYYKVGSRLYRRVLLEGLYWPLFKPVQLALRLNVLRHIRESVQERPQVQAINDELTRWGRTKSPEARTILMSFRTPMWGRPGRV